MPNIAIENLGRGGLLLDPQPYELMPEAWNRSDNVRFSNIGAEPFEGYIRVYDENTAIGAPIFMLAWPATTGYKWIYGGTTFLATITGTTHFNATRTTGGNYSLGSGDTWSGALLGDLPILTNSSDSDVPQGWDGTRFYDLPNWQAGRYCRLLSVYERFVIAYKVTASGSYNPRMVKWSEPADPGTYPSSWDETATDGLAGEVTLADTAGEIITSQILSTYNLIYKEDSVVLMRYIGGQNIFDFSTLFNDFGAFTEHSVVAWNNQHFVITDGDVIVHNGHAYESIINDKNRNFLFNNISTDYKDLTQARLYERENEIWICYADVNSAGKLNKALTWNYTNNTWGFKDLDEFDFIAYGYVDTTSDSRIYNDQTVTYDQALEVYDTQPASPVLNDLVTCKSSNSQFYMMNQTRTNNGTAQYCRLERTGLAFVGRDRQGNPKTDMDSLKFVRRVHPKLFASGSVDFYVGSQMTPNGAVAWEGPYSFNPNSDYYFDCRVQTRFLCIRIETEADIFWQLLGYTLDFDILGEAPR